MATKNFKDNPAYQFLDVETETPQREQAIPPKGYRVNPEYIEKRTQNVHILLRPSLYKQVVKLAKKQGISINEFAHRALEHEIENINANKS